MRSTPPRSPRARARSTRRSRWRPTRRRPRARLPEVAAHEDVDERHYRDYREDPPCEFGPAADVVAAQQVDPDQHYGDWVQEANQELDNLLHACQRTLGRPRLVAHWCSRHIF